MTRAPLSSSDQAYTAGPSNTPYTSSVFLILCYKPGLEMIGGERQLFCVCVLKKNEGVNSRNPVFIAYQVFIQRL